MFELQAPGINWTLVMENLDHEGFYFPSEGAFSLFMSIYARACQVEHSFNFHNILLYVIRHYSCKLGIEDPFPSLCELKITNAIMAYRIPFRSTPYVCLCGIMLTARSHF